MPSHASHIGPWHVWVLSGRKVGYSRFRCHGKGPRIKRQDGGYDEGVDNVRYGEWWGESISSGTSGVAAKNG